MSNQRIRTFTSNCQPPYSTRSFVILVAAIFFVSWQEQHQFFRSAEAFRFRQFSPQSLEASRSSSHCGCCSDCVMTTQQEQQQQQLHRMATTKTDPILLSKTPRGGSFDFLSDAAATVVGRRYSWANTSRSSDSDSDSDSTENHEHHNNHELEGPTGVACRFYLWNAPSALLHKWCHHLAKDCIYEGRGGVKFVRVAPGSMLQLLWPCSKYSPDACVLCGGNFQDHVKLKWFRNMYTPFDQWLDSTLQQGIAHVRVPDMPGNGPSNIQKKHGKHKQSRTKTLSNQSLPSTTKPILLFHRRYVRDGLALDLEEDTSTNKPPKRNNNNKMDDKAAMKYHLPFSSRSKQEEYPMEWRTSTYRRRTRGGIPYAVRSLEINRKNTRTKQQKRPSLAVTLSWFVVLETLDDWMRIEAMENLYPTTTNDSL